nr:MAG TPA: hypothetical protein [Caudoviricetes sp.]
MDNNIGISAVSCYATKAGKITDPYFYVKVPVLGLDNDTKDGAAVMEIKAKNGTDYRVSHDGDIDSKTADYYIEEKYVSIPPGPEIKTGADHYHKHTGESHFEKVHYFKLNDVPVSVGDLLLGIFLDGDTRNLVIWHIPHKVPIGGDVAYD